MTSLKRRRASLFSTSHGLPNSGRHFPSDRGAEGRFTPGGGPGASRRSEYGIKERSYGSLQNRRQNEEQSFIDDDDDDDEQVIMAVDIKERGTVGCCYYVSQEEKLYILCDVQSGGKEVIEMCKGIFPF